MKSYSISLLMHTPGIIIIIIIKNAKFTKF